MIQAKLNSLNCACERRISENYLQFFCCCDSVGVRILLCNFNRALLFVSRANARRKMCLKIEGEGGHPNKNIHLQIKNVCDEGRRMKFSSP